MGSINSYEVFCNSDSRQECFLYKFQLMINETFTSFMNKQRHITARMNI